MRTLQKNEMGIAHAGLILLVIAVLGAVGFAYWRVNDKNNQSNSTVETEQLAEVQALPQNLENLKTLDELEQIAGATDGVDIIKFVLESKDNGFVYKVVLSNGKKLVIDASTGQVLSEETTDVSEDDKIPSGIQVTISPAQAYEIAASKSSSPIKSIEMEVEDKKVVYKIEYKDGSKIEINATGGAVVKSEIKDESQKIEDENEDEDHANEDSDDSQDSEDHAEEDR